jgi:hypothetical protein
METINGLGVALALGAGLGGVYFGSMWVTVWMLPKMPFAGIVSLLSYLARLLLAGAFFGILAQRRGVRDTAAACAGFLILRMIILVVTARGRPALP